MQLKKLNANKDSNVESLPLTKIDVSVDIVDSIAVIFMKQTYVNPKAKTEEDNHAIEVTFKFPKEMNTTVEQMVVEVGDKRVESKV